MDAIALLREDHVKVLAMIDKLEPVHSLTARCVSPRAAPIRVDHHGAGLPARRANGQRSRHGQRPRSPRGLHPHATGSRR
jgi:hypothetical protein